MLQKPLVSIIIPLYNKAPYIKRALDSILSQTVQNFEIIVVGGKSTDGGEDIVRSYTDSRVILIEEVGNGVSAARNQGILVASADLIAFLDADDKWSPEYLETILRLREKYPEAGLYSTAWYTRYLDGSCTKSRCYGCSDDWEGLIPSVFYCAAMDGTFPGRTSSIVIPKDILGKVGGFKEGVPFGEDIELWARISLWYSNAHSTRPLIYYIHDDPLAATNSHNILPLRKHPFHDTIDEMIDKNVLTEDRVSNDYDLSLFLERFVIEVAGYNVIVGNCRLARKLLKTVHSNDLRIFKIKYYISTFIPHRLFPVVRQMTRCIYRNVDVV